MKYICVIPKCSLLKFESVNSAFYNSDNVSDSIDIAAILSHLHKE